MISLYFGLAANLDAAAGQAFNVGGGMANSLSLLELFDVLGGLIGQPLDFHRGPPRESDQRVFVADIAKVSRLTGWQPQVSAPEGVARMLQWVESCVPVHGAQSSA